MVSPEYQMISHMALAIAASRWRVPNWVKDGHASDALGTSLLRT